MTMKILRSDMKKVLFVLVLMLSFILYADQTDTLLVKTTVEPGYGVDNDNSISGGEGVYIYLKTYLGESVPSGWGDSSDGSFIMSENSNPIIANLVSEVDGGVDNFFILVGVNGNPVKEIKTDIRFKVDGWYKGSYGAVEGESAVDGLDIWCTAGDALSEETSSKISVSDISGSDANGKASECGFSISHAAGQQKEVQLVGYSLIKWSYDGSTQLDAGDYSSTVTITVDSKE